MSPSPKLNILVSYHYFNDQHRAALATLGDDARLLIDSGAFTAWKGGKTVELDDYCRFIEGLPITPWRYFTLDVVGDPDGTQRNYEAMLRRGFTPVPIHTRGDSLAALDRYYETSDVVALGGLVGGGDRAKAHVKAVTQHAGSRHLHLLGVTSLNWLKYLRPYSVDSSSWENGGRWGLIRLYAGQGRFDSYAKVEAMERPPRPDQCTLIRALGYDPYALAKRVNWHGAHSMARWLNAASFIAASIEIERQLGTLLFLSIAATHIEILFNNFLYQVGRGDVEKARAFYVNRQRKAA